MTPALMANRMNEVLRIRRKLGLTVGRALGAVGWEVRRRTRNPEYSLLGLGQLDIRTIIDVGANSGQFARGYLPRFPRARVVAFEPIPAAFQQLSAWAASEPRVTPLNLAIGDRDGEVEMFEHTEHNFSSSLLPTTETSERMWPALVKQARVAVKMTTLDRALEGRPLDPAILVKLDVQGYEDRVIRGGAATLRRATAAIVEVSLDPLYDGQASFGDLLAALEALGLRYAGSLEQELYRDGHVVYIDALFLRRQS